MEGIFERFWLLCSGRLGHLRKRLTFRDFLRIIDFSLFRTMRIDHFIVRDHDWVLISSFIECGLKQSYVFLIVFVNLFFVDFAFVL